MVPIRQVVRLGDSAYTTCSATGDEPITIEWSAVNRRLPDSAYVNGGVLNFRSISVQDAGKYLCRAVNYAGEAEAIAEVEVLGKNHRSRFIIIIITNEDVKKNFSRKRKKNRNSFFVFFFCSI